MSRIRTILCPVDFSDASRHAAEHAIAIARWYHATVRALHVMPPGTDSNGVIAEVEALFPESAIRVDVLADAGHPAARILEHASAHSCDLIVLGTHGRSGFEHFMLGSVAENVLRKARCAVLTVPPRAAATSALPFRRLLCALDFSESSLAGLTVGGSFARESGAALTMLHVIEWPWHEPPPPQDLPPEQAAALAEYRRYLTTTACNRMADLARGLDGSETMWRVAHGKPYVEILRAADALRADLIVMGVHGRNAADLALFGSTTNQVVRQASCPVLTIRREESKGDT
jgi:nucleotide-binding universal stress UspA family protein